MKAKALKQATDEFIAKRLNQNEPFQSLRDTSEAKAFQQQVQSALHAQIKAVSQNMPHAVVLAVDANWIKNAMPPLSDYLKQKDVYNYLVFCFEWGVKAQYKRYGLKVKSSHPKFMKLDATDFELSNPDYLQALADDANYLINLSSIDETTKQQIIDMVQEYTLNGATPDEVAQALSDNMGDMSDWRANTIARTETANAMGEGNYAAMTENGVQTKKWVVAGNSACDDCQGNEDDGEIGIDESFSSGDDYEPAHPNCECYTEAGEIDLSSIDIWGGE